MSKKIVEAKCLDCGGKGLDEWEDKTGTPHSEVCIYCDGLGAVFTEVDMPDATPCPTCEGKGLEWVWPTGPDDMAERDVCHRCLGKGYVTEDGA